MLSFDKTDKSRLIAWAVNPNKKSDKFPIYFVNDYTGQDPNIICDTPREIIQNEVEYCLNEFGLTPDEWDDILDVAMSDEKTHNYHRRYQLCVRYLRNKI